MPRSESPEVNLADILTVLESKTTGTTERCDVYANISRQFRENEISLFGLDVAKNIGRVLKVIKSDVNSSSHEVKNNALQILGVCLYDTDIVSSMKTAASTDTLKTLCFTIHNAAEKTTCSCALWCLKSQNLPQAIIQQKADEMLKAIEYAMEKWAGISVSVVHECVSTIERLNTQAPKEMCAMAFRWGKLILPLVIHGAVQVREGALALIEDKLEELQRKRKDLVGALKPVIRQKLLPGLKAFFKDNHKAHVYALKCWGVLISLFGEELHNVSYINEFLPVVELGFKSTEAKVKIAAFQSWQQLIDNFAINTAVLHDPKRIKLIMQVFNHNNARNESVALEKLTCWWHFVWLLGSKVSANFDMVATPLLQFCLGGIPTGHSGETTPKMLKQGASPVTPHMKLTNTGIQQIPVFRALQLLGCEALAHFLGNIEEGEIDHHFRLDPLTHEIVTGPAFFIKHSSLFITTGISLFCSLGKDVPESLVLHSWQWVIAHLKDSIETPAKWDIRETLNTLLLQFQILVLSKNLSNDVILKMFQSMCFLPKKILSSSAYSIGGEEMINGTPALFITGLLLTPNLLQTCSGQDSYHDLFSSLLANGTGATCTLDFLQSVMEVMDRNSEIIENQETLWRLWSAIVHPLLEHINKTNEVNQGDSLEHNFGCSVDALVLPARQKLHNMPQSLYKTMVKTWSELYKTVNRLASMVTNADANIVCEEVCSKLLEGYQCHQIVEASQVDMLVQMCHGMVACLDFSSLGNQLAFRLSSSPKKLAKKRQKPLENIHSLVALLGLLQKQTTMLVTESDGKKSGHVSKQAMLNNLVDIFSTIFNHVTSSNIILNLIGQLANPIGDLFADVCKKTTVKVYNSHFSQKLEKLWLDICTCLQSRYTSLFDTEFLHQCSPLLEATFLHSRRQIKNQTMALWTCTFGKAACLDYPDKLKPILTKVKAKSLIDLPNWVATIFPVIEETPVSQMTQMQAPEPRIPGMPSPHKIHGSFLKSVSPRRRNSPVKTPMSPKPLGLVKRKVLGLEGFADGDFVLIKHSPKKKMVLTDHQKEVMKEKRSLPAMYNSLEYSMDASLMAAHFTTDTQMDGTLSETPTPTASQPFSLFGSVIPPTGQEPNDVHVTSDKLESSKSMNDKNSKRRSQSPTNTAKSPDRSKALHTDTTVNRSVRLAGNDKDIIKEGKTNSHCKRDWKKKTPGIIQKKKNARPKFNEEVVIIDGSATDQYEEEVEDILGRNKQSDRSIGNHVASETTLVRKSCSNSIAIDSSRENSSSAKSSFCEEEQLPNSVPQNVLGAIGYFQSLSSSGKSSTGDTKFDISNASRDGSTDNESETNDFRTVVSKDVNTESENALSEPLFNWTQKLNELSTSPKNVSPLRQWSSQNSALSPKSRSRSPLKSPKRNKKMQTDETEAKGALDKWIICSPVRILQQALNSDIVVANVSQTIVEETQSPTKFAEKVGMDKGISPSVMETPPKNVLENITVSHSNSNRKLFSSQGNSVYLNMVEDSNIVPASPTSKSFLVGSPVIKLKKLTKEEIMRYSPNRRKLIDMDSPTEKSESWREETAQKVKRVINVDESSHEHDDFSVFTPLEYEYKQSNSNQFLSQSLVEADNAMFHLCEQSEKHTDKNKECMGSQNLFSENLKEQSIENNKENSHEFDTCLGNTLKDSVEKNLPESMTLDSQDLEAMQMPDDSQCSEQYTGSQEELFSVQKKNNLTSLTDTQTSQNSQCRGRQRKQITPRKLTPENLKHKMKTCDEKNKNSAKKKVKNGKEHKINRAVKLESEAKDNMSCAKQARHGVKKKTEHKMSTDEIHVCEIKPNQESTKTDCRKIKEKKELKINCGETLKSEDIDNMDLAKRVCRKIKEQTEHKISSNGTNITEGSINIAKKLKEIKEITEHNTNSDEIQDSVKGLAGKVSQRIRHRKGRNMLQEETIEGETVESKVSALGQKTRERKELEIRPESDEGSAVKDNRDLSPPIKVSQRIKDRKERTMNQEESPEGEKKENKCSAKQLGRRTKERKECNIQCPEETSKSYTVSSVYKNTKIKHLQNDNGPREDQTGMEMKSIFKDVDSSKEIRKEEKHRKKTGKRGTQQYSQGDSSSQTDQDIFSTSKKGKKRKHKKSLTEMKENGKAHELGVLAPVLNLAVEIGKSVADLTVIDDVLDMEGDVLGVKTVIKLQEDLSIQKTASELNNNESKHIDEAAQIYQPDELKDVQPNHGQTNSFDVDDNGNSDKEISGSTGDKNQVHGYENMDIVEFETEMEEPLGKVDSDCEDGVVCKVDYDGENVDVGKVDNISVNVEKSDKNVQEAVNRDTAEDHNVAHMGVSGSEDVLRKFGLDNVIDSVPPLVAIKFCQEQLSDRTEYTTNINSNYIVSPPNTTHGVNYLGMLTDGSDDEHNNDQLKADGTSSQADEKFFTEPRDKSLAIEESCLSDDDFPMVKKKEVVMIKERNSKKKSNKQIRNPKTSLRSNTSRTRLRSSEVKVRKSPLKKKYKNLGMIRKRQENYRKKLSVESVEAEQATQSTAQVEHIVSEKKDNNDSTLQKSGNTKLNAVEISDIDPLTSEDFVPDMAGIEINSDIQIAETPKKTIDTSKRNLASLLMKRNSDSKLILGSRKFDKKSTVARRSILKAPSDVVDGSTASPQHTTFHPITVDTIYSPTASPSASILKKRRLSEDTDYDAIFPSAKQRRVSFATPLADVASVDMQSPASPLTKVNTPVAEFRTSCSPESSLAPSGKLLETQSTQGSQTNYESSLGSQVDMNEPVYPKLVGCRQSVEKVLPQLTSSIWSRGLGQLVCARNIHTIGDLSALTEGDIHSLPIRSPKVDTVRKVLTKFGKNLVPTRSKRSTKMNLDAQLKLAEVEAAKNVEKADDKNPKDGGNAILASSGNLFDEVGSLTKCVDQPEGECTSGDQEAEQSGPSNLTNAILQMGDSSELDFGHLSANDLVKLSQNLTSVLSEVHKSLQDVVSTRCSSPWR